MKVLVSDEMLINYIMANHQVNRCPMGGSGLRPRHRGLCVIFIAIILTAGIHASKFGSFFVKCALAI